MWSSIVSIHTVCTVPVRMKYSMTTKVKLENNILTKDYETLPRKSISSTYLLIENWYYSYPGREHRRFPSPWPLDDEAIRGCTPPTCQSKILSSHFACPYRGLRQLAWSFACSHIRPLLGWIITVRAHNTARIVIMKACLSRNRNECVGAAVWLNTFAAARRYVRQHVVWRTTHLFIVTLN